MTALTYSRNTAQDSLFAGLQDKIETAAVLGIAGIMTLMINAFF